jgi:transcriptional regulator with XRE-family HTH domain
MASFGSNLKGLMRNKGVSPSDLARAIKVPVKSVQEWTQKDRFPRDQDILKRISEFFECSIHSLLYGSEDPFMNAMEAILEKTEIHTGLYEISIKKVRKKV